MSDIPGVCKHGHQARKCEICELERDLALAVSALHRIEQGMTGDAAKEAHDALVNIGRAT